MPNMRNSRWEAGHGYSQVERGYNARIMTLKTLNFSVAPPRLDSLATTAGSPLPSHFASHLAAASTVAGWPETSPTGKRAALPANPVPFPPKITNGNAENLKSDRGYTAAPAP
jgi:hypothetical protein